MQRLRRDGVDLENDVLDVLDLVPFRDLVTIVPIVNRWMLFSMDSGNLNVSVRLLSSWMPSTSNASRLSVGSDVHRKRALMENGPPFAPRWKPQLRA